MHGLARDPELDGHDVLQLAPLERQDRAIPLLDNRQLHQSQSRPPPPNELAKESRSGPDVKHQPGLDTQNDLL